ncbi:MAG: TolC family protein [Pseudomonadota bacterium]
MKRPVGHCRRMLGLAVAWWITAACMTSVLLPGGARAQSPQDPLLPAEVLAASERHFPRILASLAELRGAASEAMAAEGAFDLVFDVDGYGRVDGFYDGRVIDGRASQRLPDFGASVYGGYSISDGTFPIYEDEFFTNTGGKAKIGALFNLLRDQAFDPARFQRADAQVARQQAELDVMLTKIGVQQQALIAYWRWVALGRQVIVYADLLSLSTERQVGLSEQVERGAVAEIFLTENQQNISRRQALVTSSRRDLMKAGNALAFYFRDENGRPQLPGIARLPSPEQVGAAVMYTSLPDAATQAALARRPELEMLRATAQRVQLEIDLAENAMKPRLDLGVEVQQPFGSIAEGGPSRDTTDTILAMTFSVPLQQRAARGQLAAAQAELQAATYEQQLARERIELEVRNILLDLAFANQLQELAAIEVRQSEIMRDSEVRRFESGASDFFLVNVREETAANARIRLLEAELTTRIARANYDAAVVDVERLGISPLGPDPSAARLETESTP